MRQTRRVNLKLAANHRWSISRSKIIFLVMVNDLKTHQSVDNWKFVDDISMAEALFRDAIPAIQSNLESTAIWTNYNCMKLNASKCIKEMLMCFLRKRPRQSVNDKVLVLIIQDMQP